jgi:hypothetical protein
MAAHLRAEPDHEAPAGRAGQIPADLRPAIGVRANEIATPVWSSIRSVAAPATASARNGSCLFSIEMMPS